MRRAWILLAVAMLALSACAPGGAPTSAPITAALLSTHTPAPTSTPTHTPSPTATPTATPTPIPTLPLEQLGGLTGVPDPRHSNPELFDLNHPNAPIPQFVNAMRMAGIEVAPEQVVEGLEFEVVTGADGEEYVVGYTQNTGYELFDQVPLFIAEKDPKTGEWRWKNVTLRNYSDLLGINSGTLLEGAGSDEFETLKRVQTTHFNYGMITTHLGLTSGPNNVDYGYTDYEIEHVGKLLPEGSLMAHMLVWPSVVPDWLRNGNYSADQIMDIMRNWITTTMKRYPEIKTWEVVNEAYNNDFFQEKLGDDYIIEFYRIARQARPDAVLIYNDYSNHSTLDQSFYNGQRTALTKRIVKTLQEKGLIDGVGVEMVLYADHMPDYQDVTDTLKSYNLPVYVTEFQIIMTNIPGSQQERMAIQAHLYYNVVKAILNSGNCDTIIYFNQADKNSPWEKDPNLPQYSKNADPTLFNDNYQPKPAYFAVLHAMMQYSLRTVR